MLFSSLQCAETGARFENAKYVVQRMLDDEQSTTEIGQKTLGSANLAELFATWGTEAPKVT